MNGRQFLVPSLLLAGFAAPVEATDAPVALVAAGDSIPVVTDDARRLFRGPAAILLAQHRSHSSHHSHSSHSSHRSSTTGGTVYSPPPIYTPTPAPSPTRRSAPRNIPAPLYGSISPVSPSSTIDRSGSAAAGLSGSVPSTASPDSRTNDDPFIAKVKQVQRGLLAFGYYTGEIDGSVGPKTRTALEQFQSSFGLSVTGTITLEVLTALDIRQ